VLAVAGLTLVDDFVRQSPLVIAQEVGPAGQLSQLAIDDGVADCIGGFGPDNRGRPGFGWVNKLTPSAYPATLRSISIGFNRKNQLPDEVKPDSLYRVVIFKDPERDGPADGQQPDASFVARTRGTDGDLQTFNLITDITITSGSFVVGAVDEIGSSIYPALFDIPGTSSSAGTESFVTLDGGATWRTQAAVFGAPCECTSGRSSCAGSWLIRARVETGSADVLSATRIKDPLAVEPWAVATLAGEAFVANYVSDNLTIVRTSDSSFTNIPVGDGPGGTADGPAGVAALSIGSPATTRLYVSLFGSNTIGSKEFPIDYATVGAGRVQVLSRPAGGAFSTVAQIAVGKGPRYPALAGSKLYVPCTGSDSVDVIDTSINQKVREIAVGREPTSCTATANGQKVYVTNFADGTISVIDTATDRVTKMIPPLEVILPDRPVLANPWNAEVSPENGNLYIAFWSATENRAPNGGVAVVDTCRDEYLRAVTEDSNRGTPTGSDGASGIPAPTAPLTRDPATGVTPGAGGGGGGPFSLTACRFSISPLVFTNDGPGLIGVLDSRNDQVVSIPPLGVAACPKPRDVACARVGSTHTAYVACGQPDSSVLVVRIPDLTENVESLPVIDSVELSGGQLRIDGSGFVSGTRVEIADASGCVGFNKKPKIKMGGARILQKGRLGDGRSISEAVASGRALVRVISPDNEVRIRPCCSP
jgi:YVTN family beta-propeller protein